MVGVEQYGAIYLKEIKLSELQLSEIGDYELQLVIMCSAVILGLKETEETYYLLVKEPKRYQEASINCRLRGGNLAMPKTSHTNQLLAEYISQAGLTGVYIGVQAQIRDSVSVFVHTHSHT